jgi:hypothetical protein
MIFGIIIWIILCVLLGNAGKKRKIGWTNAFILSLLLSPIIGLIIVLLSDKLEPTYYRPSPQNTTLHFENDSSKLSVADELLKLKKLLDEGVINQDEYEKQKKKLIGI